jgi:antirestriction protein ArdC
MIGKTMTKTDDKMAETVTKVIELMETAGNDWSKCWATSAGLPATLDGGKLREYNGANIIMLAIAKHIENYNSRFWFTFNKIKAMYGVKLRKGAKSYPVFYYSVREPQTQEEKELKKQGRFFGGFWRFFNVFNADQLDGFNYDLIKDFEIKIDTSIKAKTVADTLAKKNKAVVNHGGDSAYYRVSNDTIQMPHIDAFENENFYASVLFHELTHWSGGPKRLERDGIVGKPNGNSDRQVYAFEELVAELGSAILSAQTGIEKEPREDHAKYLEGWCKYLKDKPRELYKAGTLAVTASKYLLDK